MIYGPWTEGGEASMKKASPSKLRFDKRKQNKLNVGAKRVKSANGVKGHAEASTVREGVI